MKLNVKCSVPICALYEGQQYSVLDYSWCALDLPYKCILQPMTAFAF